MAPGIWDSFNLRCFIHESASQSGLISSITRRIPPQGFIAATQPIDTSTSTGKLLLGVLAAVAKVEKSLIVEGTKEGLARALAQGKRLGGPPGSKDKKKRSRRGYMLRWSQQTNGVPILGATPMPPAR